MEKRKMSVLTMIIIIIVALIVGAGLGYFIYKATDKDEIYTFGGNQNTQKLNEVEVKNELTANNNSDNVITDQEEVIKYDGSKSITLNGKEYTISYVSEKFKNNTTNNFEDTEVKLYLKDKYIGTADLGYILDVNHTYGNKDYDVELYIISEDYIVILLKTEYNNGENDPISKRVFFIINTDGIHIDTLVWDNRMHIADINNREFNYEIDKEGIILYELNGNSVNKNKYTLTRDIIRTQVLQTYNTNEFSMSGK